MNTNEKIYIKSYVAHTVEDVFDKGEIGNGQCAWTSRDLPIEGRFDTIADALDAVCRVNCFDNRPDDWLNWAKDYGEDEAGRFTFSTLVDADNCEASPSDIERWKHGEKRLWSCALDVYLGVVSERELTGEELAA